MEHQGYEMKPNINIIPAHLIIMIFADSLVCEMALTISTPTIPVQLTPQPYAPMFTYVITYYNNNIIDHEGLRSEVV